ncbi:MAG: hypothetical protein AB7L90_23190 [Hyphomicrobiaceae bacterium]
MTEALSFLVLGMAICAASALLLHIAARKCRTAAVGSAWGTEAVATGLSLGLVALIVVGTAWTMTATIMMMPEALSGIGVGMIVVLATIFATLRLVGRLPGLADDGPDTISSAESNGPLKRVA